MGYDARDDFAPDVAGGEGFELYPDGVTLRALHTPGHASNHLCWLLVGEAMLFSGDHVMQGSTVVIAPPDGDMTQYLASLRRLLDLDPPLATIAPGHGSLLTDPGAALQAIIDHRLAREAEVARALATRHEATVDDLLPVVYGEVRDELLPVARKSLWAHLRRLGAEGAARGVDPGDIEARWTSTA